jgi:ABC-type Fe3+/spermidine/putrescine transport system ATPase subunit
MRLDHVSLRFDQRGIAGLHDLTLHLKPGEIFGIMGASGAGKTTLLKLLSGALSPDSGNVIPPERFAHMDMNSQLSSPLSLQEWLMSAVKRHLTPEQKLQWARDLADTFEFPMQLKRRLDEVSEGQRQRARLAYVLMDAPELLLLDEPFAHLDGPLREDLLKLLKTYVKSRGMTVVWVTHQRDEALSLSDRLGILHFGKWEQVGTPAEVYWQPKSLVVAQLLGHQNLVTVSRTHPSDPWQTPFGTWNSSGVASGKTHCVLSLPSHAFQINEQGPWHGQVIETRFLGHRSELVVAVHGQNWHVASPGLRLNHSQVSDICRFSVDLSQGVGIDCL